MKPIGYLTTPFPEKFGVPRQSGMVKHARGIIKLTDEPGFREAVAGLDAFSHVWVLFHFDRIGEEPWRPTISLPRIDPPHRAGVFASRSPHRPNPIGLSALKLERVDREAAGGVEIHVSGLDILDGTPVLDIKPYVVYTDSIPEADSGWADGKIPRYAVSFSEEAAAVLAGHPPEIAALVEEMLQWDPRPASQRQAWPMSAPRTEARPFAFRVRDLDVRWEVRGQAIYVTAIVGR